MDKVLVIVDVQKEFNDFIQHDLVDELHNYAENFNEVYQIWDTHKNDVAPTYTFPNQVDTIKKLFGKNHFSDDVKKFTEEIKDESFEGRTFKLSDNKGYIVRIDNNHDWFYVNPEITDLIHKLKDKHIILVGGADNECLEDIYQTFKAFDLYVQINKKYVYSARTSNEDSIDDTKNIELTESVNETVKYGYFYIIVQLDTFDEVEEFVRLSYLSPVPENVIKRTHEYLDNNISIYFSFIFDRENELFKFEGWCYIDYVQNYGRKLYDRIFNINDVRNKLFEQILYYGKYELPSYKPKKIERTLESNNYKYFNNITKKPTNFKYRFKTQQEFENELGEKWRRISFNWTWVPSMDYLLGNDFDIDIEEFDNGDTYTYNNEYSIIKNMVIENQPLSTLYRPRRIERTLESNNIIEKKITYLKNRIRNKEHYFLYANTKEDSIKLEKFINRFYKKNTTWYNTSIDSFYNNELLIDEYYLAFSIDFNGDKIEYGTDYFNKNIIKEYYNLFIKYPDELYLLDKINFYPRITYEPKRIVRTLENKVLKLNEYNNIDKYYVVMHNADNALDFSDIISKDYEYIYTDIKDDIKYYDDLYKISENSNRYFIFEVNILSKKYVMTIQSGSHIPKYELYYPRDINKIKQLLNIRPTYTPKKINREL